MHTQTHTHDSMLLNFNTTPTFSWARLIDFWKRLARMPAPAPMLPPMFAPGFPSAIFTVDWFGTQTRFSLMSKRFLLKTDGSWAEWVSEWVSEIEGCDGKAWHTHSFPLRSREVAYLVLRGSLIEQHSRLVQTCLDFSWYRDVSVWLWDSLEQTKIWKVRGLFKLFKFFVCQFQVAELT